MSDRGQELEAKFYLSHLDRIITRLEDLQAPVIQARLLETNLRFDLPDASLRAKGHVLRLRRDTKARLTFKGASQKHSGVLDRQEIEFVVEDFEKARQFLEALGYRKSGYYEKYRATYELDDAQMMLDELPYGNFLEIEAGTLEQIQAAAARLHLNWNAAIETSYTALFENVRNRLQLPFQDISFENFKGIRVESHHLGVRPADV
jgi:adenylate cyclase, class 2